MPDILIDDHFISTHQQKFVENQILTPKFKWEYVKHTALQTSKNTFPDENTVDGFQFVNLFCKNNEKLSDLYEVAMDVFNEFTKKHGIEVNHIVRGKCNLVLRPDNLTIPKEKPNKYMMPHIDNNIEDKIFIYYVNESDGDTIMFDMENGKLIEKNRVEPKMGRAIFFSGATIHAPSYPYKYRERAVINICFN